MDNSFSRHPTARRAGPALRALLAAACLLAPPGLLHAADKAAQPSLASAAPSVAAAPASAAISTPAEPADGTPLLALGVGDAVSVQVYGRPELTTTTYVADDGALPVPLAGNVQVAGLSPAKAAERIAAAFRAGQYLVDPQVTVFLVQIRSQQVSVLGAVRTPGRYVVESKTTVLDLLAQAGGTTENGGNVVVLLRPDKSGKVTRTPIDLGGLNRQNVSVPTLTLRGGDSIFVPPAEQFYVSGEVHAPNMYRLEPGMTVAQALSRSGGVTPRGSSNRIEIRRQKADGTSVTRDGDLNDAVQPNDVIRVKERIF